MASRRISSRRVVLTATFLALASGGVAACDSPQDDEWEYTDPSSFSSDESDYYYEQETNEEEEPEEGGDEIFYCADEEGEIVAEVNCDDDTVSGGSYFLWHSTGYPRGLRPGTYLDGGDYFAPGDKASRKAFKLPQAGRVTNGTVKTNVVGRGSSGSSVSGGNGSSGS